MPIPDNMSLVSVQGHFILLDGSPMSGSVALVPSVSVILNRNADVIISGSVFSAVLDADGFFSVLVPATDDPDLDPINFTYAVQEPTGRKYSISVPMNVAGGLIDLIDVAPVPSSSGASSLLLRGVGISSVVVSSSGVVTVSYDNGTTQVAGNVTGPQGGVGPQGVAGPVGPVGPAGLQWRGPWLDVVDYVVNDAVSFGGASYFASSDPVLSSGDPTVDTAHWQPLSLRGAVGVQGPQGPQGSTGSSGSQGAQGIQGAQGPVGGAGPTGPAGPTGSSGTLRGASDYDNSAAPGSSQVIAWNGAKFAPATSVTGVTSHGALTDLSADDHALYLDNARGDVRYYTKSESDASLATKAGTSDSRFTDARTPIVHKISHATGGSDVLVAADIGAATSGHVHGAAAPAAHKVSHASGGSDVLTVTDIGAVATGDSRLTDARTPLAHAAGHAPGAADSINGSYVDLSSVQTINGAKTFGTSPVVPVGTLTTHPVRRDDSRLTDSRVPLVHAASHAAGGADSINGSYVDLTTVQTVAGAKTFSTSPVVPVGTLITHPVRRDDSRLTDSRVPTVHAPSHASGGSDPVTPAAIGSPSTTRLVSTGTGLTGGGDLSVDRTHSVVYGSAASTAAQGNDSRLSDSRTPLVHAASHASGGSDFVTPAAIGASATGHTHIQAVVRLAPVALTDAATVATDASLGVHFRVTISASRTLGVPTNPVDGQRVFWEVTASGAFSITLTTGSLDSFELSDAVSSAVVSVPSGKTVIIGGLYSVARRRWSVLGAAITV